MNHDRQELLDNFIAVIKDLTVLAGDIAQVEDHKAQAPPRSVTNFDGIIQKEQAQILKLRGLEQHRVRRAKALGWESLTFRQILEKAEPGEKEVLTPLFTELERRLKRLGDSRRSSEQIIKVRIHEIETAIARQRGRFLQQRGQCQPQDPASSQDEGYLRLTPDAVPVISPGLMIYAATTYFQF